MGRPVVTIEMEDGKTIKMKLVPEVAPNTVNNFISLIEDNFYDGLTFHRVWEGFMIQGGDPNGDGSGGPGYEIPDEFYTEKDGVGYHLSHVRGILSMAKTQFPDSAGSQFFIMHEDSTQLDLKYAAFGIVIEGMDVVDEIASVEIASKNKPVEDVIIKTITVDLNGYEYSQPIKVE
ncbi:peptidylprolyl isomerase [Acidaminobacter sp. JC074]|uniref:peptidylprolyl isomerase n=1 Tax=Acidaminobacter sp. JC074 TaxID=2530199 RepID=UPI002FE6F1C4